MTEAEKTKLRKYATEAKKMYDVSWRVKGHDIFDGWQVVQCKVGPSPCYSYPVANVDGEKNCKETKALAQMLAMLNPDSVLALLDSSTAKPTES